MFMFAKIIYYSVKNNYSAWKLKPKAFQWYISWRDRL